MKDYVNMLPKSKKRKQINKLSEVLIIMFIGCAVGVMFLAWLDLL